MGLINTATEDAAKKISLYEDFEDDVYGGYDKINFRGKPSVQRDASKSTINNFEPPKKTKGLRKTTKNLFIFKDMGMVLSLVDDPRNNNTFLKLSPRKKSTKIDSETNIDKTINKPITLFIIFSPLLYFRFVKLNEN